MKTQKYLLPTYNEIHMICSEICQLSTNRGVTHVLGLARGGLVPAVVISHELNLPMSSIEFSSKDGSGTGKSLSMKQVIDFKDKIKKDDVVLVVDDILGTGYTIKEIMQVLECIGHNFVTATLYYHALALEVFQPDYKGALVEEDTWVVFPWEKLLDG